jgi:hypothetical protein
MNNLEIRRYEMLKHVRDYGASNASAFTPESMAGKLFSEVATEVEALEEHATAQSSGRSALRQMTAGKAAVRASLRETLEMIRRTARAMALVTPGLDDKFRIPRNATDTELLLTARAFLRDAAPLKDEFIKREVPAAFLEDLAAQIQAFELAVNGQNASSDASVSARTSIDGAIDRAMKAIHQLDPIVRNKFHNDPAALAAWESAKHTERAARTSAGAAKPVVEVESEAETDKDSKPDEEKK